MSKLPAILFWAVVILVFMVSVAIGEYGLVNRITTGLFAPTTPLEMGVIAAQWVVLIGGILLTGAGLLVDDLGLVS